MYHTNNISRGFSLIELMIGLTLGMIGMLIVSQVLQVSGTYQASISAAGEAQSIGNLSLYTIERDLKQAGFGITSPALLGCQLNGYDNTRAAPISKTLYPVEITAPALANDSDSLTVAYGASEIRMGPVTLVAAYNGTDADIDVQNRFGFTPLDATVPRPGDFFILGQITAPATPCVLGQITTLPTTSATAVSHSNVCLVASHCRYNKNGGLLVSYSATIAEFYDLGPTFNFNTYSVNAGKQLVQQSVLTGNSLIIADNVLVFKARYGHDNSGDGTIDTWDTVIPTTPAGWAATTNVRMGLAVKNPQRDAKAVTASPLLLWPANPPTDPNPPSVTLSAEDQHYRYRTYNVVVPLRNMIWRSF